MSISAEHILRLFQERLLRYPCCYLVYVIYDYIADHSKIQLFKTTPLYDLVPNRLISEVGLSGRILFLHAMLVRVTQGLKPPRMPHAQV